MKVKGMEFDLTEVTWLKSSYSGGNDDNCVEAAFLPNGGMAVRDSKNPQQAPLIFDGGEWAAFAAGVAAGEFRQH
jgi:hypothetical protein